MTRWDALTRGQQDDHKATCEIACDLCDGHRRTCYGCGHDVNLDDEYCGTCGEHWPNSTDWGTR